MASADHTNSFPAPDYDHNDDETDISHDYIDAQYRQRNQPPQNTRTEPYNYHGDHCRDIIRKRSRTGSLQSKKESKQNVYNDNELELKTYPQVEPNIEIHVINPDGVSLSESYLDSQSLYNQDIYPNQDSDSGSLYDPNVEKRNGHKQQDSGVDINRLSHTICRSRPASMSALVFSVIAGMPSHQADAALSRARSTRRVKSLKVKRETVLEEGETNDVEMVPEDELDERIQIIKQMPTTMWVKRVYRDRLQTQKQRYGLDSLKRSTTLKIYGVKDMIKEKIEYIHVWAKDFKVIEGAFGPAILSYFRFIRSILFLNIFIMLVMFFVTTFPYIFLSHPTDFEAYVANTSLAENSFAQQAVNCSRRYSDFISVTNDASAALDFLQGTGFMENTVLFYGNYFNRTIRVMGTEQTYNMSLAYLLAIAVCFFVSFLLILGNAGKSFKTSSTGSGDAITLFSNKIFCGWDYCISITKTATLKHKNISHELTVDLDEQKREIKVKTRTLKTKLKLYTIRVGVNLAVIVCLVGSLALIYLASDTALNWLNCRAKNEIRPMVNLLIQYIPSISITLLNLIVPLFFGVIVVAEEYSPSFEIYITLIRIVVLRLSSFTILVVALYYRLLKASYNHPLIPDICPSQDHLSIRKVTCGNYDFENIPCWETYVGQQIYKLVMFDFFVVLLKTFCVEFPRKLIVSRFNSKWKPIQWLGIQQFDLPENVLDLVYSQTLCWFGTFFSPLIPIICTLKCFIFFYIKKLSLLHNCNPPARPYRASKSHSFFMLILLMSFIISTLSVGYIVGNNLPSQSCGPFRLHSKQSFVMVDSMWNLIDSFPSELSYACKLIISPSFYVPIMIVLCFTIYVNWAFAMANRKKTNMLRDQLALVGRDKRYLLNRVHEAERRRHVGRHSRQ